MAYHRERSDQTGRLRSSCAACEAAHARQWRREKWQRRKAYDTWRGMIRRCHDPSTRRFHPDSGVPSFRDYGDIGIKVCRRWRADNGFENFLDDVGLPPTKGHTLDRIRCSRGYSRSNVRWATPGEQRSNRKNTHWLTALSPITRHQHTMSLSDWGRHTGINRRTIGRRLERGWAPNEAVQQTRTVEALDVPF